MVAFAPLVTFFSLLRVAECDSFSQGRRNQQKKKMDLTWWLPVMSTQFQLQSKIFKHDIYFLYIYTHVYFEIICTPARYTICILYIYVYISMYVYTYTVEYSPLSAPSQLCYLLPLRWW